MNAAGNNSSSPLDRSDALLADYVAGQLDAQGRGELLGLIRAHPEAAEAAGRDVVVDRLLRFALGEPRAEASFVRAVRMRISAEGDGSEFTRRVARSIEQTRPGRRFGWRKSLPLALAASLLAAVGVWWMTEGRGTRGEGGVVARVVEARGEYRISNIEYRSPKVGQEIKTGDRVETGKDGAVTLAWVHQPTEVRLAGNSSLETRHSALAFLERGRLTATVAKQAPGAPFVVETPQARATVVGTKFGVVEDGTGTWVNVAEGVVELKRKADLQRVDVKAGEFAVAAEGWPLETQTNGTEYVDGPILRREDFEEARMEMCKPWLDTQGLSGEDAAAMKREVETQRLVERKKVVRDGKETWCVSVRGILFNGEKRKVGISIPSPVGHSFSVEYDRYLTPDPKTAPPAGDSTGRWTRLRQEHIRVGNGKNTIWKCREFVDGRLVNSWDSKVYNHMSFHSADPAVQIHYDGIEVRQLMPVPAGEGSAVSRP